jgi:hypothetical protein
MVQNALSLLTLDVGVLAAAGLALAGRSTPASTGSAATTQPQSVVLGETLTGFQQYLKHWLAQPSPNGWTVARIKDVECALPQKWTPGVVFRCNAFGAHSNADLGQFNATILNPQPGRAFDLNGQWVPQL